MATKPLTAEAIALAEKKMDMSLDDIIKMSKTKAYDSRKQRVSNKSRKPNNEKQDRSLKIRQYMDSRSTLRLGVLSRRRTNFQSNNFPLAFDAGRKAMVAPLRNGGFNRNRAVNWNKPRAAGPPRQTSNASMGSHVFKPQLERQKQPPSQRGEKLPNLKPKTLDLLFADLKEQRMRGVMCPSNGGATCGGANNNQCRQPWLRGRFGNYWN